MLSLVGVAVLVVVVLVVAAAADVVLAIVGVDVVVSGVVMTGV